MELHVIDCLYRIGEGLQVAHNYCGEYSVITAGNRIVVYTMLNDRSFCPLHDSSSGVVSEQTIHLLMTALAFVGCMCACIGFNCTSIISDIEILDIFLVPILFYHGSYSCFASLAWSLERDGRVTTC